MQQITQQKLEVSYGIVHPPVALRLSCCTKLHACCVPSRVAKQTRIHVSNAPVYCGLIVPIASLCPKPLQNLRVFLWFTVELASIAADLGYVMGTATALSILFGLQLHWGVLLTGLDTFLALGLQSFGIRKVGHAAFVAPYFFPY